MTLRALRLDDFDRPHAAVHAPPETTPEMVEAAREAGYIKGFSDGVEKTREAAARQAATLDATLREALSDAEITLATAQAAAERALLPLVEALLDRLFAPAARAYFADLVADELRRHLSDAPHAPFEVRASAQDHDAIAAALPDGIPCTVEPALQPGQARIVSEPASARIDIEEVCAALKARLTAAQDALHQTEETEDERRQHA
ncbi:hypothetical protein [Pontivivens ytuae]|uniref:Flagellar assembly protein H n=1 Tax=Pontivivens ytuae TaxID=2789856 RepID=A0A7S9LQ13_9RHOB|nr:hypothetical protein [Pontivivens ytuae]QPH53184.1 hypothetical protein I0K15_15460 [Pontivivens ytuae]